jgi:FMN phosphatase YigB (HAD superfamily)
VTTLAETVKNKNAEVEYVFAADETPWIGFDFDGTLAHDSSSHPVASMVRIAKAYIKLGRRVKICTARVSSLQSPQRRKEQIAFLQAWAAKYLGKKLEVTSEKDHLMLTLYDDRARQVRRNTGEIVG